MQGQQKIIDDIISSAKSIAASVIEEATAEKNESVEKLRAELDAENKANAERDKRAADDVYAGQVKLGELEAGKIMLAAKQRCVAAVYDGVKQRLLSAKDEQYLAVLQKLIVSNCEDGDEIISARSDVKRVTDAWVKKVATAAKKKLTLSKERGDFSGGVILRNDRYDRDLTVDEVVNDLKERTVTDIVAKLGLQ